MSYDLTTDPPVPRGMRETGTTNTTGVRPGLGSPTESTTRGSVGGMESPLNGSHVEPESRRPRYRLVSAQPAAGLPHEGHVHRSTVAGRPQPARWAANPPDPETQWGPRMMRVLRHAANVVLLALVLGGVLGAAGAGILALALLIARFW